MSAQWSLTYLQTRIPERDLFETVANLFNLELDGQLYGYERDRDPYLPTAFVKLDKAVAEWFENSKRAKLIFEALLGNPYGSGVLIYPQKNGLLTIADSVIHTNDTDFCGRTRRVELMAEPLDPQFYSLFKYMSFLKRLTETLDIEAAHIMYERNPAGRVTGIHFYKTGQLVDEYFAESVEADPDYENVIDLPEHPEVMREILGGRFAFLVDQPKRWSLDDEEYEDVYFEAEHLGKARDFPEFDVFNLRDSDLYVPFWDETMLPLGAVYCLNGELPDYFLKTHT
jgi:hypothetical protein